MHKKFNHIWSFEPDLSNEKILKESLSGEGYNRITFNRKALSDNCKVVKFKDGLGFASEVDSCGNKSVDSVALDSLPDIRPTIIKLHIEGDELKALYGAANTIRQYRPIIMVLADHNSDGLFEIANFLKEQYNYKLFFYLHDYCGNSAVFYSYPLERI